MKHPPHFDKWAEGLTNCDPGKIVATEFEVVTDIVFEMGRMSIYHIFSAVGGDENRRRDHLMVLLESRHCVREVLVDGGSLIDSVANEETLNTLMGPASVHGMARLLQLPRATATTLGYRHSISLVCLCEQQKLCSEVTFAEHSLTAVLHEPLGRVLYNASATSEISACNAWDSNTRPSH